MRKFAVHSFQLCCICIVFVFVVVLTVDAELNEPKRFMKEQGLMPFPRVGRRDDALKFAKLRNELFAFPRIGRSQATLQNELKRNQGPKTMNTGLWFGPRLGRVQKRNIYGLLSDLDDPNEARQLAQHYLAPTSDEDGDLQMYEEDA